jgi:hypothetical protein
MVNGRLLALAVSLLIGGACTSSPVASVPSTSATLQSVTLGANLATMTSAGQTTQVTATGVFLDGTSKDLTATCTNWQSDNASVVIVNSTGMLTAQGSGSSAITTTCQGVAARAVMTITFKPATTPSTFSLSGTITDGFSGGVLPNVYAQITDGANHGRYTRTDAAGNYRLDGLSPGVFTLTISAVTYVTTIRSVTLSADTRLDIVLCRACRPSRTGSRSTRRSRMLPSAFPVRTRTV